MKPHNVTLHSEDVNRTAQYFRLLKMARIVKTLRIIRIFKLARHSTGLQALGNTMKANYRELGLLFLLLGMGAIMFASLIFVFEKEDADTTFHTMLDAYWSQLFQKLLAMSYKLIKVIHYQVLSQKPSYQSVNI